MDKILLRAVDSIARFTTNFCEKVEIAVASMKKGKSAGASTVVQADRETMIDSFTKIYGKIWRTR